MAPKSEVLQATLDRAAHPANFTGRLTPQPGDLVSGTAAAGTARLDRFRMGVSENNRKAKFYSLTKAGRKQLREETEDWQRMPAIINRLLETAG